MRNDLGCLRRHPARLLLAIESVKTGAETLISVWRQVLVEDATTVVLESRSYIVRHTSRSKLWESISGLRTRC